MDSHDYLKTTKCTYSKRAAFYEKETDWIYNDECIAPFLCDVFGTGLAFDACAGTCAISKALIQKGWNTISYDISKEMLERGNVPFPIIGDVHSIPTLDKQYDLVVCRQGLQYTSIDIAISELVRICKKTLILGHITLEPGDDTGFWNEYFRIAAPGRRRVFMPDEMEKHLLRYGCVSEKKIIHQQDYYMGPLLHLTTQEKMKLHNLLEDATDKFKTTYNVQKINDRYTYSNRWEFIRIDL